MQPEESPPLPQAPYVSGLMSDGMPRLERRSIESELPRLRQDLDHLLGEVRTAIREFREAMGFSQTALAKEISRLGLNLDGTAITRIETGQRGIRVEELWAIAAVLQVELSALIPRDPTIWGHDDQIEAARRRVEDLTFRSDAYARELEAARHRLQRLEDVPEADRLRGAYRRQDRQVTDQ